jgi:hypothetical protein
MEAEKLIKKIKEFVEEELGSEYEAIITPTMYDPKDLQYNVSFIVMKKVEGGMIPRFNINLKDLVGIQNLRKNDL